MKHFIALLMLLALATAGWAEDQAISKATMNEATGEVSLASMHAINNVVSVKDGKQTALCGCGMEFEVTASTPVVDANGMTFYCCGPGCHEHVAKATPEEAHAGMAAWQKLMDAKSLSCNTATMDGKQMAKCACGMDFEVKAGCHYVLMDGMKVYTCCDGCAKHVCSATAEERTKMLQKALHTACK